MSVAIFRTHPGFDPDSLWLDDQWVASLLKLPKWTDLFLIRAATPIGFSMILRVMSILFEDKEWPLQLVPLICFYLQIPILAFLATRISGKRTIGLLTALLITLSPHMNNYAICVKQYTCESFIISLLLWCSLPWLCTRQYKRFIFLCVFASFALFFSFTSLRKYINVTF